MDIKYCKKCVMPNTRPGIRFDEDGVCSACRAYENRKKVDWDKRFNELEKLCDKYRGMNGKSFDCAIAVSGGKDSHFQVYIMKEVMKMNPVLFSVEDNFPMTEAGIHNIKNLSEEFGCNIISIKPDIKTQKLTMRYTFEKYGKPTWIIDRLIYVYPLLMSLKFNTPLLVYGENVSYEYGGVDDEETYSAKKQIYNGAADMLPVEELTKATNLNENAFEMLKAPSKTELDKLDPMYLSYFVQWNSFNNYDFAKSRGFHDLTHEWNRTHHVENFDQIDSRAYLVHSWMKYPKFAHQFATDYASRMVRYGIITRDEAVNLVKKHDAFLDPLCVQDFCKFLGYTETQFWNIVNKFYNPDYFEKVESHLGREIFRLKKPIV